MIRLFLQNAFSVLKQYHATFSVFDLLVPDLLHELEIGVWKAFLVHALRLIHAHDPRLVDELNRRQVILPTVTADTERNHIDTRFRNTPPFGRSTIRQFYTNVSELKQLAAFNYEDILQVRIL